MDNSTEYCCFVSADYIICECGENFSNENSLRVHLDNDHAVIKHEKPVSLADDFTYYEEEDFFLDDIDGLIQQEEWVVEEPVNLEYYVANTSEVKQEDMVEYVDQNGAIITKTEEVEPQASGFTGEAKDTVTKSTCKQVVFKIEQLKEHVAIVINPYSNEHNYDKEETPQVFLFCEVCGKSFTVEKLFKRHMAVAHKIKSNETNERKPKQKKQQTEEQKQKHREYQREKFREKRAKCGVCGKRFPTTTHLTYHFRTHTGEKPYKCPEQDCDKAFTTNVFLQAHIRTHTGEKPFQCQECPKAFSRKAALSRHELVHTGSKPYACPECGKAFSQSNSVKVHYQTVHLKMPAPYKSAARKLTDMQREYVMQGRSRVKRVRYSSEDSDEKVVYHQENLRKGKNFKPTVVLPHEKLLFRHGKFAPTHYEYTVDPEDMIAVDAGNVTVKFIN